jgi:hypothetical protein
MTLAEIILDQPVLVFVLSIVLETIIQAVRGIGYRRAYGYHRLRRVVWPLLDPLARRESIMISLLGRTIMLPMPGRPLLRDKTGRDDEHIATVDVGIMTLLKALWKYGFRWNPLSTLKYIVVDGSRQHGMSVVYYESDSGLQQDVHIFRVDGQWRILGHREPDPTNPGEHVGGDEQVPGDPHGHVAAVLDDRSGIARSNNISSDIDT